MTPEENLRAAAEYLSDYGHHKGQYFEGQGGSSIHTTAHGITAAQRAHYRGHAACAMGALLITTDDHNSVQGACAKIKETIGIVPGANTAYWDVPGWNDSPHTSAEDVILTMKRAAEL